MPRVIYFKTSSEVKLNEVRKQFNRYGVQVVSTKPPEIFAKIKESTTLLGKYGPLKNVQLEPVIHRSVLIYAVGQQIGMLENSVSGYLDFTRAKDDAFGFDSIFVVDNIHKTYYELDSKISARDHNISLFIEKFLYRTTLGDWKFNPQKFLKTLELERDPMTFFENNVHTNNIYAQKYGITNMIKHVINSGIFFRASMNRRQGLYWFPGLNSGIPFVSKPNDPIHELVFFIHDMGHQIIPDLIYTGETDDVSRFCYIVFRLLSESSTLIFADVFFVNSLLRAGFKYETIAARKIYPFFDSMGLDFDNPAIFVELLCANAMFCMFGETTEFEKFNPDPAKLADYAKKYDNFFLQDFEWTCHNFDDMRQRAPAFSQWWQTVKTWATTTPITITKFKELNPSVVDAILRKDYRDACMGIFNWILKEYILPTFMTSVCVHSAQTRYDRMFRRYMMGQAMIFTQYPNDHTLGAISARMNDSKPISFDEGVAMRNFYKNYVENLHKLSLITNDDCRTYSEIYPLFEPMIVSYDQRQALSVPFVERISDWVLRTQSHS